MKIRGLNTIVFMLTCVLLVAGCTTPSGQNNNEEKQSLKVMYFDETYFYQQYGDLFSMKYPNIDIEVVSTTKISNEFAEDEQYDYKKLFIKYIEKEQPDVLLVNPDYISTIAAEGNLVELQPLIDRDKYDMTTYSQGVLDSIKEMGEGKLYALSPKFNINAIFYNADLFKKYGVEPPRDGMTWEEILDTARRFPTDGTEKGRIYGYGSNSGTSLDQLATDIANAQGLSYYNGKSKKITMNTDYWKNIYKMSVDAVASKAVYTTNPTEGFQGSSMEEYYASQPFLMGRVAMTVDGNYLLSNMKEAASNLKDYKGFEIGIVAGPIDPTDPTKTNSAYIKELFAIRAGSPNIEAAWNFIKFINGEQFAKVKSKTINNGLPTREGISKEYNGVSLEAFYKLKPKVSLENNDSVPKDFYNNYLTILQREVKLLEENKKTVDEALNTVQHEAQIALDQAFKAQEAQKESK
ncbi:extracellular solute-binding protein [Paenibacillus turicensis]|uniref:ABC transporter substrate-binding protein n=1 Tax=Paenibacillus turicensis TaxID=160487 RepID=UPI003D2801D0